MSDSIELSFQTRADIGKGSSRRLRREADLVPAVIYGAGKAAVNLQGPHNKVIRAAEAEAFYSSILALNIDGKQEQVVIKDIQRHPYKNKITHIDFMRVSAKEAITMTVPLHFLGAEDAPGIKAGGMVEHLMNEVEISCLPKNLPEHIDVDVSELDLGEMIHLGDVNLPKGVSLTMTLSDDHNPGIVSIHRPKVQEIPDEAPEATDVEAINKGSDDSAPKE